MVSKRKKRVARMDILNYSTEILRKLGDPYASRFRASLRLLMWHWINRNYYFLNIYVTVSIVIVPY